MNDIIYVHTGEVKAGHAHEILQSSPIGSCVVIMAWCAHTRFGSMAHIMLPGLAPRSASMPAKYAINALERLADHMAPCTSLQHTGVCLLGAANVLNKADDTICHKNILSVTDCLKQQDIPIHAAELGGYQRRMARLYVREGRMTCTQGDSKERMLWNTQRHCEVLEGVSAHG